MSTVRTSAENSGPLAAAARSQDSGQDLDEAMLAVADAAVSGIDSVTLALVNLTAGAADRSRTTAGAATGHLPAVLDAALTAGPVAEAFVRQAPIVVGDADLRRRWPELAVSARDRGVASVAALPFASGEDVTGVLILLGTQPSFTGSDLRTAALLANQATRAALAWRQSAHLRRAIASRDVIGQAKGILMERLRITADEAFALLVQESQLSHRKLSAVAEDLALTGSISRLPG